MNFPTKIEKYVDNFFDKKTTRKEHFYKVVL